MKYYDDKQCIRLASSLELVKNKGEDINIFLLGDTDSGIYDNFIYPNLRKWHGSYIIIDYENKIYNEVSEKLKNIFKLFKYDVNQNFNLFMCMKNKQDVIDFSITFIKNSSVIINRGKDYTQIAEMIVRSILLYVSDSLPSNKRNLKYIKKVIEMLKKRNLEYFKKVFSKRVHLMETYKQYKSIDRIDENIYKEILILLLNLFNQIPEGRVNEQMERLLNISEICKIPSAIFIELSKVQAIDSFICMKVLKKLHNYAKSKRDGLEFPIMFVYNQIEKIGYIHKFNILLKNQSSIDVVNIMYFESMETLSNDLKETIKDVCNYGVIFKTKNVFSIIYLSEIIQKYDLAKIPIADRYNIKDLYKDIMKGKTGCIVYQKNKKITEEYQINGKLDENPFTYFSETGKSKRYGGKK